MKPTLTRQGRRALGLAVLLAAVVWLASATVGAARAKPTCFGKPATIVGSNGFNHISGTR